MQEGKNGVTQVVSYLGDSGLSKRGPAWWEKSGSGSSCLASGCDTQVVLCSFEMDAFEMDASGSKVSCQALILQGFKPPEQACQTCGLFLL